MYTSIIHHLENMKRIEHMGRLRRDKRTISELKIGSETVDGLT
jgi:hypothetical protein